MNDYRIFTIVRPVYAMQRNILQKTGKNMSFPVTYSGTSETEAMARFLTQHSHENLAEVLDVVGWMETGYYASFATLSVVLFNGLSHEFKHSIDRRTHSGQVILGRDKETIEETRTNMFLALSSQVLQWIKDSI